MQPLQHYSAEMPLKGLAPNMFLCGLTAKQNKGNHSQTSCRNFIRAPQSPLTVESVLRTSAVVLLLNSY